MLSLKKWAVWTAVALLVAVAAGQVALAQTGQQGNTPVFNPEYLERAAKNLLPEVKIVASSSGEFSTLVESYSAEERETQIKRILPFDRAKLNLNPVSLVPFVFNKGGIKLYLPETAVLRSSFLQALIRGNGKHIAPVGVIQVGDKFMPVTLQGEPFSAGGKTYLSMYDENNKVTTIVAFPQENTIGVVTEVLRIHGPDDRFSPEYTMYFIAVVMMNIAAFLMN
jgi:hypothetical protein